jgi:hypothetical protein
MRGISDLNVIKPNAEDTAAYDRRGDERAGLGAMDAFDELGGGPVAFGFNVDDEAFAMDGPPKSGLPGSPTPVPIAKLNSRSISTMVAGGAGSCAMVWKARV